MDETFPCLKIFITLLVWLVIVSCQQIFRVNILYRVGTYSAVSQPISQAPDTKDNPSSSRSVFITTRPFTRSIFLSSGFGLRRDYSPDRIGDNGFSFDTKNALENTVFFLCSRSSLENTVLLSAPGE